MKRKIITMQLNTSMKKEDREELERELSEKLECKVVLIPTHIIANTMQIIK